MLNKWLTEEYKTLLVTIFEVNLEVVLLERRGIWTHLVDKLAGKVTIVSDAGRLYYHE